MHWSNPYIGIPFSDANCYDLMHRVYLEVAQIELPYYHEPADKKLGEEWRSQVNEICSLEALKWIEVPSLAEAQEFDVILFRVLGEDMHVGVYVNPTYFLHSYYTRDSGLDRIDKWKSKITQIYRHPTRSAS